MTFRALDTFKYLKYPETFQYPVFKMKVSAGPARFNFSEIKTLNCFAGGSSHATQPHEAVSSFGSPPQVTPEKWNFLESVPNYSYCSAEAETNCLHFRSRNNRGYSKHFRIYFFAGCRLQEGKRGKNYQLMIYQIFLGCWQTRASVLMA